MLVALLLAAASIPAKPIDLRSWFSANDYPVEAQKSGAQGSVRFQVDIDSSGKPTACHIAKSSGSPSLDDATCRIVLAKGRFSPATLHGKAVPSTFSTNTVWRLEGEAVGSGYVAIILSYGKDPTHPECSIVQRGTIAAPTCEQALSRLAPLGASGKVMKLVTLVSAVVGTDAPYRGEADWGQRLSFSAVDLYFAKDGKKACSLVTAEGSEAGWNPCTAFPGGTPLTDEEKRTATRQRLEQSTFAIIESSANTGTCKTGESASEARSCS